MVIGIGIIGYLVGAVANLMIDFTQKRKRGLMDILYKNHIIICNYPNEEKILNLLKEMRANDDYTDCKYLIVTDAFTELPEPLAKAKLDFIYGNPADEETLMKANVIDSSGVIILAEDIANIKSDEKTYVIGSLVELIEDDYNISIKTVTEIIASKNISRIERVNVDGYFSADGLSSAMVVQEFINPGINKVISQVVSNTFGSQLYLVETKLTGMIIRDIQIGALQNDINIQIIGIESGGENVLNPSKTRVVAEDDKLIVLAEKISDFRDVERALLSK
jgi:voltage-gated potassium channel